MRCFSCNSEAHFLSACPLVHYIPNKMRVIKQYTATRAQIVRRRFKRKKNKHNCLNNLNDIRRKALKFVNDNDFKNHSEDEDSDSSESELSDSNASNREQEIINNSEVKKKSIEIKRKSGAVLNKIIFFDKNEEKKESCELSEHISENDIKFGNKQKKEVFLNYLSCINFYVGLE